MDVEYGIKKLQQFKLNRKGKAMEEGWNKSKKEGRDFF
jgi:hypothetical protein